MKCLPKEHNTMSPARGRTQTTWSINHKLRPTHVEQESINYLTNFAKRWEKEKGVPISIQLITFLTHAERKGETSPSSSGGGGKLCKMNNFLSVLYVSVLLLMIKCIITLSKWFRSQLWQMLWWNLPVSSIIRQMHKKTDANVFFYNNKTPKWSNAGNK